MRTDIIMRCILFMLSAMLLAAAGCTAPDWPAAQARAEDNSVCAVVNGVFLDTRTLEDITVAAYGDKILQDMIMLELARAYAAKRGITLTEALYQARLAELLEELAPGQDRQMQQRLFDFMLIKNHMTAESFALIIKKQALLKACIDQTVTITEPMLQAEYQRQYGPRRIIRLIETDSLRQINELEAKLAAGESFSSLVREYSLDETTLRNDGLSEPLSPADEHYPAEIISRAFALPAEQAVSEPFMTAGPGGQKWYKIRLEKIIPPVAISPEQCRQELEKNIVRHEIARRLFDLQEQLRHEARIVITDKRIDPENTPLAPAD